MPFIRRVDIENFRSIQSLRWCPQPGVNCLISPGDSGKSTLLDAIDWCLSARREPRVSDADFHCMDFGAPIRISLVLGALESQLADIDRYGPCLHGYDPDTGDVVGEPDEDLEPVLIVDLTIDADLDPLRRLRSNQMDEDEAERMLQWRHRELLEPTRIGTYSATHLGWRRGSILGKLTDESVKAPAALAAAGRAARDSFGEAADEQLHGTLGKVRGAAAKAGIADADALRVALDAQAVTVSGGALSVHDTNGVPLRNLGLGSSRLLVAELQREAGSNAPIALIDETEHGLEPHRIARLLISLGSKAATPTQQIFMTTHSPAAIRELRSGQLYVLRREENEHLVLPAGDVDDSNQGTLRSYPEAFLGSRVLVCEGATEVGFIRGVDRYFTDVLGESSFSSDGAVLVDAGGDQRLHKSTPTFCRLGYPVATLRDDDTGQPIKGEDEFLASGGLLFKWSDGCSVEQEIFRCVSDDAVVQLLKYVQHERGRDLLIDNLVSVTGPIPNKKAWAHSMSAEKRAQIAEAAGKFGWFKRMAIMEDAAHEIIAPDFAEAADRTMVDTVSEIFAWARPNRPLSLAR